MVNMGEKLKNLRIKNRLTQKQVSERIGVITSAISAYESLVRYPSYSTLIRLARMYHVSTDYLLGITPRRGVNIDGLNDEQIDLICRLADELRK